MRMKTFITVLLTLAAVSSVAGAAVDYDLSRYKRQSDLEARVEKEALVVAWRGERDQLFRVQFVIEDGTATVRELALQGKVGQSAAMAQPRLYGSRTVRHLISPLEHSYGVRQ